MKVVVTKAFRDKYTKARYEPGTVLNLHDERVAAIRETLGDGYIETVAEPKKPDKPEKHKTEKPS